MSEISLPKELSARKRARTRSGANWRYRLVVHFRKRANHFLESSNTPEKKEAWNEVIKWLDSILHGRFETNQGSIGIRFKCSLNDNTFTKPSIPIILFNDSSVTLRVRINIAEALPSVHELESKRQVALFMRTDQIFCKVWDNGVIMFQDRGNSIEVSS